jgi:hypothetical protein
MTLDFTRAAMIYAQMRAGVVKVTDKVNPTGCLRPPHGQAQAITTIEPGSMPQRA